MKRTISFVTTALVSGSILGLSACGSIPSEQQISQAPPPATVCQIVLIPPGTGAAKPLRVGANTTMGCTVALNQTTVVPPGAFAPGCIQLPLGRANSIVVGCTGVPVPAVPPALPTSALGLSFDCSCPPPMGPNNRSDVYLF